MSVAVVTGASSGLGKEYIGAIINEFPEIDEIWMIARRKERLGEIAAQYPQKKCKTIALDLAKDESFATLDGILSETKPDIKLLVSNSAVAVTENFAESDVKEQLSMCNLNVKGATAVTRLCLAYMKKGSIILETCSVAAFAPTPRLTVYSSTKAYLLNFSKGLREELKTRGINVCAICPGNMDTEMLSSVQDTNKPGISHYLPHLNVYKVAVKSLVAAKRGKAIYTPGTFYKFYRLLAKILPHNLIMKFSAM